MRRGNELEHVEMFVAIDSLQNMLSSWINHEQPFDRKFLHDEIGKLIILVSMVGYGPLYYSNSEEFIKFSSLIGSLKGIHDDIVLCRHVTLMLDSFKRYAFAKSN